MDENGINVPAEVKGWNWGAFMYNIFGGIGNKTYLPLLCLIPVFNFVWIFVCGFKGNEWAWQKGDYKDVETFKAVQTTWNRAGIVQFIIAIAIMVLYFMFFAAIISSVVNSNNY
ncbi:ribonuclease G [Leuconostoc pseudomesenteroides]|uniref:ribonuclease G n=1 Tax=Leuconostoc pseudomesenteroides TaxID=33968 RepID=UPI001B8CC4E7|nr:ribonuclease G [Leuconostoc pseudomesenteroides]MBS0958011.1 ribonuclease G [Leuconostoc pseudomesenteroides]